MRASRRALYSVAVLAAASAAVYAQSIISAKSGTLHYSDGEVSIDDKVVEQKPGKFPQLQDNAVLRTSLGRAEILLTPGVFLRVGEKSAIRMLDTRLASTRVELLEGSVMIESDYAETSSKDPAATIIYKGYEIQPVKLGLFGITTSPEQLRVYKGQAIVSAGTEHVTVKDGRQMPFSAALVTEKFDEKSVDDLYLWTRDRSAHLSAANMASARNVANQTGGMYNGYGAMNSAMAGYGGFSGRWYYNSFLGMYTYLPANGISWSPFGYGYFSPGMIYAYYSPDRYYWNGGGSARTGVTTGVPLTNIGTSGVAASQITRAGSGLNTHSTLGSPIRSSSVSSGGGFRGMDGFAPSPTFGGGVMYGAQSSGAGRGFDNSAVSGRFGGNASAGAPAAAPAPAAPVSAPAMGAGGGPGAPRGR